jgi:hypothetical protein
MGSDDPLGSSKSYRAAAKQRVGLSTVSLSLLSVLTPSTVLVTQLVFNKHSIMNEWCPTGITSKTVLRKKKKKDGSWLFFSISCQLWTRCPGRGQMNIILRALKYW